jgi:DNA-binding CsgD family transcriptional regulator
MDDGNSLSRLTEREKVCLRQWLQHKSAKEIAADLGISHHAVEKRLKMARIKLGARSSLDAARMLVEAEGYGQAVPQSPDLVSDARPLQSAFSRVAVVGVAIMIFVGAIMLALLHPAAFSQTGNNQHLAEQLPITPARAPTPGTEAMLRRLVAGLASGSPPYDKLSPQFAETVRRDLPMTHPMFNSMGELKSMTFRGRGEMGDDVYDLKFAKGEVIMSAKLDADGRMAGGFFAPPGVREVPALTPASAPTRGTETILRSLVAGLASGSPDYSNLSPQFADVVRGDLPRTHPMFSSMGELKSVTFRGRGPRGDDVYDLVFANGGVRMSVALDADGRMIGGMLQPVAAPGH